MEDEHVVWERRLGDFDQPRSDNRRRLVLGNRDRSASGGPKKYGSQSSSCHLEATIPAFGQIAIWRICGLSWRGDAQTGTWARAMAANFPLADQLDAIP